MYIVSRTIIIASSDRLTTFVAFTVFSNFIKLLIFARGIHDIRYNER